MERKVYRDGSGFYGVQNTLVFMHELGHNILGLFFEGHMGYNSKHGGYNPRATNLDAEGHCEKKFCAMVAQMKWYEVLPTDYCTECWLSIDLELSFNPNKYNY